MASNLTTIGFDARTTEEFEELVFTAARQGTAIDSPMGSYIVWPEGPEQLWAQVNRAGALVGGNPHFAGPARIEVAVVDAVRNNDVPMDGYVVSWANPRSDEPEVDGDYPFVADLPDFDAATDGLELPWKGQMQVAAFARTLTCWPDDAAYEAAEQERWGHRETAEGQPVRGFAAESFIPAGMFTPGQGENAQPTADALFTGHVLATEILTNAHTGMTFRHVLVRSLGGEYDVVADPTVVEGEPVVGGVVQGQFWLSGRLLRTR